MAEGYSSFEEFISDAEFGGHVGLPDGIVRGGEPESTESVLDNFMKRFRPALNGAIGEAAFRTGIPIIERTDTVRDDEPVSWFLRFADDPPIAPVPQFDGLRLCLPEGVMSATVVRGVAKTDTARVGVLKGLALSIAMVRSGLVVGDHESELREQVEAAQDSTR